MMNRSTFILILLSIISCSVDAAVKPQDHGLLTANNGLERYMALYNAHEEANRLGSVVDYSGTDSISIEIPKKAKSIQINGSTAVINYFANGSKSYDKERVEVFSQGRVLVCENWRKLIGYGVKGFRSMKGSLDKGQKNEFRLLNERLLNGGESLIPIDSIINTTKASFAAIESLREHKWIEVK